MGKAHRILLIGRAHRFSPNSVERDRAILLTVADRLRKAGHELIVLGEQKLDNPSDNLQDELALADIILSMGRGKATLEWLARREAEGTYVVNSARALLDFNRRRLLQTARQLGVPTAPFAACSTQEEASALAQECPLPYPVWWKRDDRTSQELTDVQLIRNDVEWQAVMQRGVTEFVVEQHLRGDLVKFYGVEGNKPEGEQDCEAGFFRWNYPQFSKFGNEAVNGREQGHHFDATLLRRQAGELAKALGLQVYGGDAIVTPDGTPHVIDLNDWPSFSSCREEAARAIVSRVQSSELKVES